MLARVINTLVPPEEMNGSGIPLVGSNATTTLMLKNACTRIVTVSPNARKRANGSVDSTAARSPRYPRKQKSPTVQSAPIKPSSSQTLAKIKSVCRSGR